MGKAWYYRSAPLPVAPPEWSRGSPPRLYSFVGRQGTYEIRQAHATCFALWLHRLDGTIDSLPPSRFAHQCFEIAETYDENPYEITDAMLRSCGPDMSKAERIAYDRELAIIAGSRRPKS
jgi:hypothetical protein